MPRACKATCQPQSGFLTDELISSPTLLVPELKPIQQIENEMNWFGLMGTATLNPVMATAGRQFPQPWLAF